MTRRTKPIGESLGYHWCMFRRPTVFILGAGASMPLFPTGSMLTRHVCKLLADDSYVNQLVALGHSLGLIEEFQNALQYSHTNSVDAFLERRTEFLDLGKMAIALYLIKHEDPEVLHNGEKRPNWYQYFWNKLSSTSSFDNLDKSNATIITFNYDRSFEHFLFTSAVNFYGRGDEETAEKISALKFIHLHGNLGFLPWQQGYGVKKENKREYKSTVSLAHEVVIAADSIRIVNENVDVDADPRFQSAQQALRQADKIYILGFGYHPKNVERLKLAEIPAKPERRISSTGTHLTDHEVNGLKLLVNDNTRFMNGGADCLTLLRKRVEWAATRPDAKQRQA